MAVRKTAGDNFSIVQIAAALLVALDIIFTTPLTLVKADNLCDVLISPLGYACNDYTVQTPDGFLLGMYNIPYGRGGPGASLGRPVLLFHGFQGAGDNWLLNSAEESLAPILADLGYDVWIGNNRNVQWSRGNTQYGYNDTEYWDWSWDQLAKYDVLSSIDFVYSQLGNTPISYVCHSQGCMTFLAALTGDATQRTQVEGKIRLAVLLAPFAYNGHITAPVNKFILSSFTNTLLPLLGVGPVDGMRMSSIYGTLLNGVCKQNEAACDSLIAGLVGPDSFINDTRNEFYLNYFPQVTSSKNYNHYGQIYQSQLFQKYDNGPKGNLLAYGTPWAPHYDLSTFPTTFPVQIFAGGRDGLADPEDFATTLSGLPTNLNKEMQYFPNYGHLDFIIGSNAYVDIYPLVNTFLTTH